jgi:GTP-binding protein EngB required for normal cell division
MADIVDLLDAFDRLVAAAAEVDPDAGAEAGRVAMRERRRRGYLGDTVLVALAGGTGSGKSSLINALAGEEIALTGPQRPTTNEPLAWIPANPEPGLTRLLDDIGIAERVGHAELPWLAVIDLPDMDSVADAHRMLVERLLPEVDAVVWVVDPEKYQDRALHEDYLAALAAHAARFRFVFNQIDRVGETDRAAILDDLRRSLRADGIDEPVVIPTAADPPIGPPWGIDELLDALRSLGVAKDVVRDRIVVDVVEAGERVAAAVGVEGAGGTGFAGQWDEARSEAASAVATDLVGPAARREIVRAGRSAARGAIRLIRPAPVPASFPTPVPSESGPGRRIAVSSLDRMVGAMTDVVEGEVLVRIRRIQSELDAEVEQSSLAAAVAGSIRPGDPPAWWSLARWLRVIGTIAAVVGLLMVADGVRARGDLLIPGVVVVASLAAVVVPTRVAISSGARWAGRGFDHVLEGVTGLVDRELDRRIGRPIRDALRVRAGAAGAYAEFRLAAAEHLGSPL